MKILWLKTELLHPVDKGGKIRTYQMLRELKNEHEITYLALDDGPPDSEAIRLALEYADEVITVPHATTAKFTKGFYLELAQNLASPLPYFMQKYRSPKMREEIADQVKSGKFDVVVCDFLMPAINIPEDLGVPSVLFQHNVEAQIWRRHYEVQKNPLKKAYLWGQWRKTFDYERAACRRFDLVVAVSAEDADLMDRDYGVSNLAVVPTGVDTEFFTASKSADKSGNNIVFTGSMDWLPNEDAIRWFVSSIYPTIRRRLPDVSLTVVGRAPSASLVEQCRGDASIKFTGRVDDVRKYMDEANVYIVPIRIGGGTRLKIYEAMSMGLPIVSTGVGAEGLTYKDGKDIVIRDDEAGFAGAVIQLFEDKELAARIGSTAEARAKAELGWRNVARLFGDHCRQVVTGRQEPEKESLALARQAV